MEHSNMQADDNFKKKSSLVLLVILGLVLAGVLVGIVKTAGMNTADYVKRAEALEDKTGGQSVKMIRYNLEKAAEKSIRDYGEDSVQTADIYERLAVWQESPDASLDYLNQALVIYKNRSEISKAAYVQYLSGEVLRLYSWNQDGDTSAVQEAYREAIGLYGEAGEEDEEGLFLCYYGLGRVQTDLEQQIESLKIAEELGTPGGRLTLDVLGLLAETYYRSGSYEEALRYAHKVIAETGEANDQESLVRAASKGYYIEALSSIKMDRLDEAAAQLDKAVAMFDEAGGQSRYLDLAMSYAAMAQVWSRREPANESEALSCGEKALSFFTERNVIDGSDWQVMEAVKANMEEVFKRLYPEDDGSAFTVWYSGHSRLRATTYQYP